MSDVKHLDHVALDRKQDSINMRPLPVEQLSNLDRRVPILWSQRATRRKIGQRADGASEGYEPALAGVASLL